MISIFRHGINNDDIGPIAKASFEETPNVPEGCEACRVGYDGYIGECDVRSVGCVWYEFV